MKIDLQKMFPLAKDFFYALITATFFSAFIYMAYFNVICKVCDSLFGIIAIVLLLHITKRALLLSGFFIGLLWFYWIGYSFKYYGVNPIVEPFVAFGFGIVYTLFFGSMALTNKIYIRALIFFGLTFISPYGFNWLKPELLFINSYFGTSKLDFAIVLTALVLTSIFTGKLKYIPLLLLFSALHFNNPIPTIPSLKIDLVATNLNQFEKWNPDNLENIINMNLTYIDDAINKKYDAVVLPESAFPMNLNEAPILLEYLSEKSKWITIITGALVEENGKHYNVTYHFEDGNYTVAKKVVLVPFGEYIPLPSFFEKWVSETIFHGASDFTSASVPSDYTIKGVKFRNAICYEASTDKIYENTPSYIIATSNNGWFLPSIEPTLQNLLFKYYARKYNVIIFHSANPAGTGIIY
ncbi:MAG: apolipoprotein N-acyltransferase [Thiovulaceae bacterium]|nr:apolipoprotein N-acyltransferase [Sulfurimonadaceae bacterium]